METFIEAPTENLRTFEPDYPEARNPWDAIRHPDQYSYIQSIIHRIDNEEIRPPKYTEETRQEIFRLRDLGHTLREISEQVGASKSTVCLYLQNRHKLKVTKQQSTTGETITVSEVDVGKIPVKKNQ